MVFCVLSGQHSIDVFLFKFKHVSPCYPWMDNPFQLNIRFYLYFWLLQEKEACRCSIKETVKSMLAFGWTIERTKEGEAFGLHTCKPRVSQSGQVCVLYIVLSLPLNSKHAYCNRSHSQLNFSCTGFLCVLAVFWRSFNIQPQTYGHEQYHVILGPMCKYLIGIFILCCTPE